MTKRVTMMLSWIVGLLTGAAAGNAAQYQFSWLHPRPQANAIGGVAFEDPAHGYAVGDRGTVLETTDGGATWHLVMQYPALAPDLEDLLVLGPGHLLAVGAPPGVFVSLDSGRSWTPVPNPLDGHAGRSCRHRQRDPLRDRQQWPGPPLPGWRRHLVAVDRAHGQPPRPALAEPVGRLPARNDRRPAHDRRRSDLERPRGHPRQRPLQRGLLHRCPARLHPGRLPDLPDHERGRHLGREFPPEQRRLHR